MSIATAWKSIARVNQVDLNPGDKVLFEGGKTFGVSGSVGSDLIANPGFESGLADWTDTLGSNARTKRRVRIPCIAAARRSS